MADCSKCGAKWEARIAVDNCPFCGAPLTIEDNSFSGTLSRLIERNGLEVLYTKRYVAMLRDLLPDEAVKCRLMSIVVENGVGKYIADKYKNQGMAWDIVAQNAVIKLNERVFIDKEKAQLIVQEIGISLGAASASTGTNTAVDKTTAAEVFTLRSPEHGHTKPAQTIDNEPKVQKPPARRYKPLTQEEIDEARERLLLGFKVDSNEMANVFDEDDPNQIARAFDEAFSSEDNYIKRR